MSSGFGTFFVQVQTQIQIRLLALNHFCDSAFDEEPSGNVEQGGFGESFELASVRRQFIRYFEK